MTKTAIRAFIEAGLIVFFLYSNLLIAKFERSGMGWKMGLGWVLEDIFTTANFGIAILASLVGCLVIEFVRKKLWF